MLSPGSSSLEWNCAIAISRSRLLPATQRVDVERQHLDRGLIETQAPGGHRTVARVADGFNQRRSVAAIEPNPIGEIFGADILLPGAVIAVAGDAIVDENLTAAGDRVGGAGMARERQDVVG